MMRSSEQLARFNDALAAFVLPSDTVKVPSIHGTCHQFPLLLFLSNPPVRFFIRACQAWSSLGHRCPFDGHPTHSVSQSAKPSKTISVHYSLKTMVRNVVFRDATLTPDRRSQNSRANNSTANAASAAAPSSPALVEPPVPSSDPRHQPQFHFHTSVQQCPYSNHSVAAPHTVGHGVYDAATLYGLASRTADRVRTAEMRAQQISQQVADLRARSEADLARVRLDDVERRLDGINRQLDE